MSTRPPQEPAVDSAKLSLEERRQWHEIAARLRGDTERPDRARGVSRRSVASTVCFVTAYIGFATVIVFPSLAVVCLPAGLLMVVAMALRSG